MRLPTAAMSQWGSWLALPLSEYERYFLGLYKHWLSLQTFFASSLLLHHFYFSTDMTPSPVRLLSTLLLWRYTTNATYLIPSQVSSSHLFAAMPNIVFCAFLFSFHARLTTTTATTPNDQSAIRWRLDESFIGTIETVFVWIAKIIGRPLKFFFGAPTFSVVDSLVNAPLNFQSISALLSSTTIDAFGFVD